MSHPPSLVSPFVGWQPGHPPPPVPRQVGCRDGQAPGTPPTRHSPSATRACGPSRPRPTAHLQGRAGGGGTAAEADGHRGVQPADDGGVGGRVAGAVRRLWPHLQLGVFGKTCEGLQREMSLTAAPNARQRPCVGKSPPPTMYARCNPWICRVSSSVAHESSHLQVIWVR
jgi:hypothetical protein